MTLRVGQLRLTAHVSACRVRNPRVVLWGGNRWDRAFGSQSDRFEQILRCAGPMKAIQLLQEESNRLHRERIRQLKAEYEIVVEAGSTAP